MGFAKKRTPKYDLSAEEGVLFPSPLSSPKSSTRVLCDSPETLGETLRFGQDAGALNKVPIICFSPNGSSSSIALRERSQSSLSSQSSQAPSRTTSGAQKKGVAITAAITSAAKLPSGNNAARLSGKESLLDYCAQASPALETEDDVVTLVFTDIEKSTVLWEKLSPSCMEAALNLHDDIFRLLIERFAGYEVKAVGDAFIIAFNSIIAAVQFCVAVQQQLLEIDWPKEMIGSGIESVARITGASPQVQEQEHEHAAIAGANTTGAATGVGVGAAPFTPALTPTPTDEQKDSVEAVGAKAQEIALVNARMIKAAIASAKKETVLYNGN